MVHYWPCTSCDFQYRQKCKKKRNEKKCWLHGKAMKFIIVTIKHKYELVCCSYSGKITIRIRQIPLNSWFFVLTKELLNTNDVKLSEYCFVKEMEEIENEGSENERQHPLDAVKAMKDTQIIIWQMTSLGVSDLNERNNTKRIVHIKTSQCNGRYGSRNKFYGRYIHIHLSGLVSENIC